MENVEIWAGAIHPVKIGQRGVRIRSAFESSLGGGVATDLYGTGDPPKEDGLPDWREIAADLPRWSDLD